MAATDRFMIAPLNSGLQTDSKPWLIPDDAFQELTNVYVFRGRVRKRFGATNMNNLVNGTSAQLSTRLRVNLGNTNGSTGNFSTTVPGNIFSNLGQMFSVGTQLFTVYQVGAPAAMYSTGTATGTYDTSNGDVAIIGAAHGTAVYWYPSMPVTGLCNFNNQEISNNPTFAFDPQFAYEYSNGAWLRLDAEATSGAATWIGNATGSQLVWAYNWVAENPYQPTLYVTNYNYGASLSDSDLMRFWDGTQWNFFNPAFNSMTSTDTVVTARIIVPFKNRLVLLNVVENTGSGPGTNEVYVNRARWSWAGDPTNGSAFYDDINGYGSYADAPTTEAIVTSQFLKDRLIVYFESSTWELVYTGNQIQPFQWQQLNTELGAQSTFSEVPFDKVVLGIGNVGVHACNGSNVERIDDKIPDQVFDITPANQGLGRVYGIRDYYTEQVYWTFPAEQFDQTFPNRILVYNYKTGSWSFFLDSFTAFGYYEQQSVVEWQNDQQQWQENNQSWNSGVNNPQFKQVIAGNQQGFVQILKSDVSYNDSALYITKIVNSGGTKGGTLITITCMAHNLNAATQGGNDFISIFEVVGMVGINNAIYPVNSVTSVNVFTIVVPNGTAVSGSYLGGGVISRVSNIGIVTKQYNFYVQDGRNCTFNKVDFLFDTTAAGQINVDYSVSASSELLIEAGKESGTLVNTGIVETSPYALYPLEATQSRVWHPIYPFAQGECIQLKMYMSNAQITNADIAYENFVLHAMTFYTKPTSSRLQ